MSDDMSIQGIGGIAPLGPTGSKGSAEADGVSFKDMLFQKIDEVNHLQSESETAMTKFATGETNNVTEVFVAVQKADLAFKTLMQIRNKLLDAYEEINQLRL